MKTDAEIRAEHTKHVAHVLGVVEGALSDSGRSVAFINSIRKQFDKSGWLTVNQLAALMKFYARVA